MCPDALSRTARTTSAAGRVQQFPRARDVAFGGLQVADGEPQNVATVEPGVGEKDIAGRVDRIQQSRVLLVGAVAQTEADDAERDRRDALETIAGIHPRREALRELHVPGEVRAQPL